MDLIATTCKHCGRAIELADGLWVDPEATGDDSVWREGCDAHDTFTMEHEPEPDSTGAASLYPCGHTSHDERVPAVVVFQFPGHGSIHGSCHEHAHGLQECKIIHDDRLYREPVPADFEVRPIVGSVAGSGARRPEHVAQCGHCGLFWDDGIVTGMTPAPSGRCPFEYQHLYP